MKCSKCDHVWHQASFDAALANTEKVNFTDMDLGQWDPAGSHTGEQKSQKEPAVSHEEKEPLKNPAVSKDDDSVAETTSFSDEDIAKWSPKLTSQDIVDYGDFAILRANKEPRPSQRPYAFYGTIALISLLLIGGIFGRSTLVKLWPPFALLYERTGLPVPVVGAGLAFRDVVAVQDKQGALWVAQVRGQIVNESQMVVTVPTLAATLGDNDGASWQDVLFPVDISVLLPGETVDFQYELPLPGENVTRVTVSFSDARPASGGLGY